MTNENNLDIDIAVLSKQWPPLKQNIKKLAAKTMELSGFTKKHKNKSINVSIALADDEFVRSLNKRFRNKDEATNVLSFPNKDKSMDGGLALGDVAMAYETIEKEAKDQGKTFRNHASHLIVHGILHLIGYDHETGRQASKMEALEVKILKSIGIKNPYE